MAPVPACWLFKTSAWSWPFDLESGVRVTCEVGYLCANFSLPRPLCSRVRPDVRDRRQTDRRQTKASLNASALVLWRRVKVWSVYCNEVTVVHLSQPPGLTSRTIMAHVNMMTSCQQQQQNKSPAIDVSGTYTARRQNVTSHQLAGCGRLEHCRLTRTAVGSCRSTSHANTVAARSSARITRSDVWVTDSVKSCIRNTLHRQFNSILSTQFLRYLNVTKPTL